MTFDRAIEILDPEHREVYGSIDPVNEACRMGMEALKYQRDMTQIETQERKSWIEDCAEIICPYCSTAFKDEIAFMYSDSDKQGYPRYCPECGKSVRVSLNGK